MENNTQQYRSVTPPIDQDTSHPLIKMVTSVPEAIPKSRRVKTYSIKDGSATHLQLLLSHHADKININRNELLFLTRKKHLIRDISGIDTYSVKDSMSGLELLTHLGLGNTLYCYKRSDVVYELTMAVYTNDMSEVNNTYGYARDLLTERQESEYLTPLNEKYKSIHHLLPYVHSSQVYAFMRTGEFARLMNELNGDGYLYSVWVDKIVHRHPHWKERLKGEQPKGKCGSCITFNLDPLFNLRLNEKMGEEGSNSGSDGENND